ncbi:MAG: hypothetical protein KDI63_13590 [Gammaproteobacteria bacterium]|nr:hypothetical protein [Gammaproteobacteria bacterium]
MPSRLLLLPLAILQILPLTSLAADSWQIRLTPYLWFAGLKGDVATIPGAPAAPIDIPASDALDDTESSLMFLVDAKHGRHGLVTDFLYSDVRSEEELIPSPIGLTLRSVTKTSVFSLAYQYEIYRHDQALIDLMLGARYWHVDSKLRFGGGLGLLAGKKVTNDESWIDPALGIKGRTPLGGTKFYLEGGVILGGFGVGSDHFYEFNGAIGYQWNQAIGTAIGYRMFDVDYEENDFIYDVRQQGWQIGLTWSF